MAAGGYKGNDNLVKAGSKLQFTRDQLLELKRCKEDPVYFAETYFKIIDVDKGLVPFKLYDFQKDTVNAYIQGNQELLLNTSRQAGKTSVATVIILHYALFSKDRRIAILANKLDTATEILERIQIAYEYLPSFLQNGVKVWNKKSVLFHNGSKILAAASSSSAIRGKSQSMIYIDECAFIPRWAEFSSSVLPTLSSGKETISIFTSTPNGLNHFYHYVEGAKNKTNNFWYQEVPWYMVPGRGEAWKKKALELVNHNEQQFKVEYECAFEGSSGTLISGAALKKLMTTVKEPTYNTTDISVYSNPEPKRIYTLLADVSRGLGKDYSAFQIIDVTEIPYREVATYNNNTISPLEYAKVIYTAARSFNNAAVLVEINDIGEQVVDCLREEYEYDNLVTTKRSTRTGGKQVTYSQSKRNSDGGVRTTSKTKMIGCSFLKMLVEQEKIELVDRDTVNQLRVFSQDGSTYKAEEGYHDDLVMPLVLFGWLTDQEFFKQYTDLETLQYLKTQSEADMNRNLISAGFLKPNIVEPDAWYDRSLFVKLDPNDDLLWQQVEWNGAGW